MQHPHLNEVSNRKFVVDTFFNKHQGVWIALAAPSQVDFDWAESKIIRTVGQGVDLETYIEATRQFPYSIGKTAEDATRNLNNRLSTVQRWDDWAEAVARAYSTLDEEESASGSSDTFISEAHDAGRLVNVDGY